MRIASSQFVVLEEEQSLFSKLRAIVILSLEMTKAELKAKQFQKLLGPAWWVLEPSVMSIAFFLMSNRLNYSTGDNHFLFIFISTGVWRFFSNCMNNSLYGYVSYGPVIRQTSFPLLAVNFTHMFTEFIMFICGFAVVLLVGAFSHVSYGWALLGLFPIILLQILLSFGLMIFLSCLGVYVRDLPSLMAIGLNAWFILSPSIYDIDRIPAFALKLQIFNPFFFLFPAYRSVIIENRFPNWTTWSCWMLVATFLIYTSLKFYERVRPNFLRVL